MTYTQDSVHKHPTSMTDPVTMKPIQVWLSDAEVAQVQQSKAPFSMGFSISTGAGKEVKP